MFIRLKTTTSTDLNVNVNQIKSFEPTGDHTVITFADGSTVNVLNSTQSLRGYIKKALGQKTQAHTDENQEG